MSSSSCEVFISGMTQLRSSCRQMENTVTMVRKAEDIQEGVKFIRKDMVDARVSGIDGLYKFDYSR
jgi:hypothetical protein